jgi:hypothetical protein
MEQSSKVIDDLHVDEDNSETLATMGTQDTG